MSIAMSYRAALLLLCCAAIPKASLGTTSLKVSEKNGSSVFVELLRGRDGLPGRDGAPGMTGPQGSQGPAGPPGPSSGGAIYTRWGKSSCPEIEGTAKVYSGITGGSQEGGGANYLCMPKDPKYNSALTYRSGVSGYAHIYGSEYADPLQGTPTGNVPCAVCYVATRPTVLMIPAKFNCPPTWTREYYGYIMTEHKGQRHINSVNSGRTMFECVDEAQESLPNSNGFTGGVMFYHVEAVCGTGLPCGPFYDKNKELNCVVCTK